MFLSCWRRWCGYSDSRCVTREVRSQLQVAGEKLGKAIRNAEMDKIPVVCVVGPRDIESGAVSVRTYWDGQLGPMEHDAVIQRLCDVNKYRKPF